MESYIVKNLDAAKEYLESGIQFKNPSMIKKGVNVYDSMKDIVSGDTVKLDSLKQNIVRGLSALCIYDEKNALQYMTQAEKVDPENPVVLNNFGFVYHKHYANWDKSIQYYEKCLSKHKDYTISYLGIVDVYRTLRYHVLELEYCKKGVENCPESAELWNSLGLAKLNNNHVSNMDEIHDIFRKALSLECSDVVKAKVYTNIGHLNGLVGDFSMAVGNYCKAIQFDKGNHAAHQNILLNLHYFNYTDVKDQNLQLAMKIFDVSMNKGKKLVSIIEELHCNLTKAMYGSRIPQKRFVDRTDVSRKIRIGYLTYDLVDHAVSFFLKGLLANHNHDGFEVYIYSNNVYDASTISQIRCTGYRSINDANKNDVVAQMQKDKLDIVIDLSGHTSGNRLDVVALRPAPIVLSYLGYPDDTGFPFVKRISDVYTEKLNKKHDETAPLLIKDLFLCYTPKEAFVDGIKQYKNFKPAVSQVTFGCFAKLQKINSNVIEVWVKILKLVPNGRLLLKSKYFADEKVKKIWTEKFGDVGERLILLSAADTADDHMNMFKKIDIHLDTFPYSGTTITTESLYMNVPVITMVGDRKGTAHVHRVSGSILCSMGLEGECVAKTTAEYIQKAVSIIYRLPNLPSVRKRFLSTVISKPQVFTKNFEDLLISEYVESSDTKA